VLKRYNTITHSVSGELQLLVFGVGVCFLPFEYQQTERKVTSQPNLWAGILVCNRKLQKWYHQNLRKNVLKLGKSISDEAEIYHSLFVLTFRTWFT